MSPTRKLFASLAIGASILGGAAVGGCSSKATPEEFKAELVKNGIKDSTAQCIIDEMKKQNVEIPRFSEMKTEDSDKLAKLSGDCAIKEFGLDPATVTTPKP